MVTSLLASQNLPARVAVFIAFAAASFFVFALAAGYAPLVIPIELARSLGLWYLVVVGIASSLAVGLPAGLLFGAVLPRRTLVWSLAASATVALAYVACALSVRFGHTDYVWWTPFTDAGFFVGVFTAASCLSARVRRVDTI